MSATDDAETASTVLDFAGQFAFIFPGAGQVVGGALSFIGGLMGLAADRPDVAPSRQDLENDIDALGDALGDKLTKIERQAFQSALAGAAEQERTEKILFDKISQNRKKYLEVPGDGQVPQVETDAHQLHSDLTVQGKGTDLTNACNDIEGLGDPGEQVAALLTYCTARTRLHSKIQNYLFLYQAVWAYNNAHGHEDRYPKSGVPKHWYNAPILMSALQSSLETAIDFAEPRLKKLKQHYRTRLQDARAAAAKADVPAMALKQALDKINSENFLDRISEPAVDSLLGTDKKMGVVDFWRQALQDKCGAPYNGEKFVRGDKLDPPRQLPTVWLNGLDTPQITACVENAGSGTLPILHEKQQSKLAENDRPFVGVLRNVPDGTRLLTLVVVNTTADPLLLAEPVYQPHGGMISKPVVAHYPHLGTTEGRGRANFKPTSSDDSADPESWVDAAPLKAMGAGTAAVGVWQFMTVPSDGAASASIKFKALAKTGYKQLYVGGEFPADASKPNCCSVGISDHGSAEQYFKQWIDGKGVATDASSACSASVWPPKGSTENDDVVITVLVR
jgi:hypothetical protein